MKQSYTYQFTTGHSYRLLLSSDKGNTTKKKQQSNPNLSKE